METSETAGDVLDQKDILGECGSNSRAGRERAAIHDLALDAKERGDLACLFQCYRDAIKSRTKTEALMVKAMGVMCEKEVDFHMTPVEVVRDIALAAISLAEKVSLKANDQDSS